MENLITEATLMGWRRSQWAVAAKFFEDAYGWLPLPDMKGADRVRQGWESRNCDDPPAVAVLLDERERPLELGGNRAWTYRMFRHAALKVGALPFKEAFIGGKAKARC